MPFRGLFLPALSEEVYVCLLAPSGSCDVLTPSFNPCLAAHPTAWVSRRGQDTEVTVSLLVPRAGGDKPSILEPEEALRKNGASPLSCFQDSGPALTLCFSAARGYRCTGKVGVRFGPAVNKVSMSVPSLAGGKKPRSSCSDLWIFLPRREEEVRTRPGRGTWQRLVTLPLTDFLETAQHV